MPPAKINFKMYQGSTFSELLRWESSRKIYKPITAITQAAPCIITATGHGVPDGWRVKVTNVVGMKEINSTDTYNTATFVDVNSVELNDINSVGYTAYTSGGILEYNEPIDLTLYTARMQLRHKVSDTTVIDTYDTTGGKIVIDPVNYTISIIVDAVTTATYTFSTAVYNLELELAGVVTTLAEGNISLIKEVTR